MCHHKKNIVPQKLCEEIIKNFEADDRKGPGVLNGYVAELWYKV